MRAGQAKIKYTCIPQTASRARPRGPPGDHVALHSSVRGSRCAQRRARLTDVAPMGQSRRLPYFHGGGERPLLRGSVMANLLLVWPVAVAVHFGAVALFEPRPGRAAIRLLVGIATTLNVFFSDRYHNSDLRYPDGSASQRTEREVAWLRCDFVGTISTSGGVHPTHAAEGASSAS